MHSRTCTTGTATKGIFLLFAVTVVHEDASKHAAEQAYKNKHGQAEDGDHEVEAAGGRAARGGGRQYGRCVEDRDAAIGLPGCTMRKYRKVARNGVISFNWLAKLPPGCVDDSGRKSRSRTIDEASVDRNEESIIAEIEMWLLSNAPGM